MKKLLIAVGVLLAIPLLATLVGFALPQDHVATLDLETARAPGDVWRALTDVEGYPAWRSDVDRIEFRSARDGAVAWTEIGSSGSLPFAVVSAEPSSRLVTRIDSDQLPFGGS